MSKAIINELVRTDIRQFARMCHATLYPGKPYLPNWHIEAILYKLMQIEDPEEANRLIVNMPPQHMKSLLIAIIYVAWRLGHDPGLSIIVVSYSEDLVKKQTRDIIKIMEADWYKAVFKKTRISPNKKTETEFETTAGGRRYATTVKGQLTGHGADLIIVDDPHKIGPGLTEQDLVSANSWFDETLSSRLTHPDTGTIIVVMQRTRPNDLTGYLLATETCQHLSLPLIAEKDEDIPILNGKVHHRKAGEILHLEWRGEKAVAQAKKQPHIFESQYQQNPQPGGGSLIKPHHMKRYQDTIPRSQFEAVLMGVDGAYSTEEDASYSAIVTIGLCGNNCAIIDVWRGHVGFSDLGDIAINKVGQFNPDHVIIENAASGISLLEQLRKKFGPWGIHDINPKGSKVDRFYEVASFFNENRIYLPDDLSLHDWLPAFEQELYSFPHGQSDDQVDALVHILRALQLGLLYRPKLSHGGNGAPVQAGLNVKLIGGNKTYYDRMGGRFP